AARGPFDVTATAAMGRIGGFFDAAGDRVPSDPHGQGGLAESRSWDAFAKLGLALGGARRLQLTGNWYDLEQQTDFVTLPSAELGKASVREGLELDQPQNAKNGYLSLDYTQPFAGGRAHAQLYYRDYLTRFGPSVRQLRRQEAGDTARVRRAYVTQSFLDSEKGGGRLELETRLGARRGAPSVTWGADYVDERTFQALNVFDRDAWTAGDSLVYRKTDEWMWVPPLHTRSLGLFAQAAWSPVEPLTVRGGIRHERARADVHDFTTIEQVAVTGGALRYRPVLLNAGAVVTPVRGVDVFANFSQGFSLADLGRILRGATSGFILGTHSVDAQLVDQYEVGARATGRQVQASLSLFRNTSALGSTYDAALNVVRAPERVYGLEATLDVQPAARWQVGGTFTWTEGEAFMRRDTLSTDSVWKALGGYRIQPPKVTGYVQHATTPGWTNRVQLLASGRRTRAYEEFLRYAGSAVAGSETPLESFATLDLLSSLRVGAGTLTLGVENLLNRLYFSTVSQLEQGTAYRAAARGRTLTVGYGVRY
ncbi:MAG TPA: TonB-dependent receptor, partial [Gemmatimonadales bacterium]|nr:TonB-dependent receptor [Gemmatimonadales bacterium]